MASPQIPLRQVRPPVKKAETEADRVARALLSPDTFSTYFLQTELWDIERSIMQAVATKPRVAVKACHASGKTFTAAEVALWSLARFPEVVVVTTAPTWNQVQKLMWGEIHSALLRSRYPFPKASQTEIRVGPKRYAYGLSTSVTKQDEGVKFQGIHAERVLVIIDEAPGVDPKIWEAIEGARAGGNVSVLALGNPTIASGPFHEAFTDSRFGWTCFTIDAFDTPNLKGLSLQQLLDLPDDELNNNVCPYLTTRRWVKEKYYEWGLGHPSWEARVRGQFPTQSEFSLLSLAWLEEAAIRELPAEGKRIVAGLDVAGPGEDETSLTIRQGPKVLLHKQWPHSDPRGEVVAALLPFKNGLDAVNVDSIGIGWGMYQHLLDLKFPAVAINVSESSSDSEKYANCKAEFYWGLRIRLEQGDFCGLIDERTIGQLAGIQYKHNSRGQIYIESKEEAAKRGVKSPDRAESVMLAFAERSAVYGALEVQREIMARALEMQKVVSSQLIKPAMSDVALACPSCKAICVSRVATGWRCGQCGEQWMSKEQEQMIQKPMSRKDLLMKVQ